MFLKYSVIRAGLKGFDKLSGWNLDNIEPCNLAEQIAMFCFDNVNYLAGRARLQCRNKGLL